MDELPVPPMYWKQFYQLTLMLGILFLYINTSVDHRAGFGYWLPGFRD